jgi:hypothetical protein
MSQRKPAKALKRTRGPKIAARAQHNKQAIVRSSKNNPLRSVAAGSIESPRKRHGDSEQKVPIGENRVPALQGGLSQVMKDGNGKKGSVFSLATANMQAYQGTLLEMAHANMQFAFEFGQRIATIRSPFDFFAVIAEFTSRRMDMFSKYSKQMYPLIDAPGQLSMSAIRTVRRQII